VPNQKFVERLGRQDQKKTRNEITCGCPGKPIGNNTSSNDGYPVALNEIAGHQKHSPPKIAAQQNRRTADYYADGNSLIIDPSEVSGLSGKKAARFAPHQDVN
jgi:hypothetical protein